MPGAYPYGSGDALNLVPNYSQATATSSGLYSKLTSTNPNGISRVIQSNSVTGSYSLGGTFALTLTTNSGSTSQTTQPISADASASELEAALNALSNSGTVSVSRTSDADGYTWLVTFDGCKIVGGSDVCNIGNVSPLVPINTNMIACAGNGVNVVLVTSVTAGSGPGSCGGGSCVDYVTDLSGSYPYSYLLTSLSAGTPYYVRVSAHNA